MTLCWYDPPAPLSSSRNLLMQDLDMVVVGPDGSMHWGNANEAVDAVTAASTFAASSRMKGTMWTLELEWNRLE